jgi:hypothetical protein
VIDLTVAPDRRVLGRRPAYRRTVFLWLANWWDGVDLWLSQLAFPFQFAIVVAVLAPVCFGVALLVDRVVDLVTGRRLPDPEPVAEPMPLVRADVPAGTPATIISAVTEQLPATAGRGPESAGS